MATLNERSMLVALGVDDMPVAGHEQPVCPMSRMVKRLELLLPAGVGWCLLMVRQGDYEVRTSATERGHLSSVMGRVGRGMTPTDALADLVGKLGEITHAA